MGLSNSNHRVLFFRLTDSLYLPANRATFHAGCFEVGFVLDQRQIMNLVLGLEAVILVSILCGGSHELVRLTENLQLKIGSHKYAVFNKLFKNLG